VNADLADSFGNLVNRCLRFAHARFDGVVPAGELDQELAATLHEQLRALRSHHEALQFRKAADAVRGIWRLANTYLAKTAPWRLSDPAAVMRTSINLVRVAAIVAWPFVPTATEAVLRSLGEPEGIPPWPEDGALALCAIPARRRFTVPDLLFRKLDNDDAARLARRGSRR
jgi:methionyl-tRNA synthetase